MVDAVSAWAKRGRWPGTIPVDRGNSGSKLHVLSEFRGVSPESSSIARPGVESTERLDQQRWKIERSIAWLFGYRRLAVRYERKGSHFLAFLSLAAALTCHQGIREFHHNCDIFIG
jgi:hypothetical protein